MCAPNGGGASVSRVGSADTRHVHQPASTLFVRRVSLVCVLRAACGVLLRRPAWSLDSGQTSHVTLVRDTDQ